MLDDYYLVTYLWGHKSPTKNDDSTVNCYFTFFKLPVINSVSLMII